MAFCQIILFIAIDRQSNVYIASVRSGLFKERFAQSCNIMSCWNFLLVLICIVFPPGAVLLKTGCGEDFFINILLTLFGYIPGHFHGFYVIFSRRYEHINYYAPNDIRSRPTDLEAGRLVPSNPRPRTQIHPIQPSAPPLLIESIPEAPPKYES
jgi:uncharacterized membrane protein YqaE (UPF0057 family)